MKSTIKILSLATCLVSTAAVADSEIGKTTQQWLDLQKSGEQAAPDKRPLAGEVADRNWQRYLKSFESDIPDQFESGVDVNQD